MANNEVLIVKVPRQTAEDIIDILVMSTPAPDEAVISKLSKKYLEEREKYVSWFTASFQLFFEYLVLRKKQHSRNIFKPKIGEVSAAEDGVAMCNELIENILTGELSKNLVEDLREQEVPEEILDRIESAEYSDEMTMGLYVSYMIKYFYWYFVDEDLAWERWTPLAEELISHEDFDQEEFNRILLKEMVLCYKFLKSEWNRDERFVIGGRGLAALTGPRQRTPKLKDQKLILKNMFSFFKKSYKNECELYTALSVIVRYMLLYMLANDGAISYGILEDFEEGITD